MLDELLDDFERDGRHVRAHPRGFDDMNRMTYAGGQDFRAPIVVVVNLHDLREHLKAVLTYVIKPPDKGADVGRSGFGSQNGLRRGEAERDVDLRALFGQ